MSHLRPRVCVPWFLTLVLAVLAATSGPVHAGDGPTRAVPIYRAVDPPSVDGQGSSVANSNCLGTACDTVWIGHSNSGPGGAFLGVSVGGVWDFDTGIAGTDSTQGWRRQILRWAQGIDQPPTERPSWHLDYGNVVNEGNTNLWNARDLAGRKYVKTGIAGVWHSDNLVGVKLNVNNVGEPSAAPIAGTRSAWCGLRESGNTSAQDALTGNYINGDLISDYGTPFVSQNEPEFPGYCNQWDQLLYKDFSSTGTGTLAFRVRVALSTTIDGFVGGSGWFNPDPTSIANYVQSPSDSFMVYVGAPTEVAYDTNRRWFSEILDLTKAHQELFAASGTLPVIAAPDTALSLNYSGLTTVGGKVRVVFRVKTNRPRSDMSTGTATGFNTKDGAAVLDQVQVNGGTVYGFETAGSTTARSLIADIGADGGAWATTGKPVSSYYHVANIAGLIYEDLCGAVGASTRRCNLQGNVILAGDHDNGNSVTIETFQVFISPTINLAVRNAAPGTKNSQGIDQETASRPSVVFDYDWYTGFANFDDQSVFVMGGAQAYQPGIYKQPVSGAPMWSTVRLENGLGFNADPICFHPSATSISVMGVPTGSIDSLRICLGVLTQGFRFGGTDLGNTRGTYFDNIRLGLVREAAPLLGWNLWSKLQDQFPVNENVVPGDNAAFDTTTAYINTGNEINDPSTDPGSVAGDSIVVLSPYSGNGSTTGTRLDLIFRIDPGPGNYTVKGDRSSPLVNKDPAHPFFATYLASNGTFGTPGGHGGTWNKNVWNSARMDSCEQDGNLYPILSRSIGVVNPPEWQGTLHEQDPNFATLGISHAICFLVDPAGPADDSNIDCSGSPPLPYGAVTGLTKEGTKILPDGWFSPGTHIEYFVRRSTLEAPSPFAMMPDTNTVLPQDPGGFPRFDAERWFYTDVLPDMWKSTRYGGAGLACMLMVDAADRRGADPQWRGAADTLGYGKNNGATQGWKGRGPRATAAAQANDPLGFVPANLGQYGLNFDHFNITTTEGSEAGRLGSRFAQNIGAIAGKKDMAGPSAAMLATFYTLVGWSSGDNSGATLADGFDAQEGPNDVALLEGFLAGASASNRRGVWLAGEGIAQDAATSDDGTHLHPFLTDTFGADLVTGNFKSWTNDPRARIAFIPTAPWAHPTRVYGMNHGCLILNDLLSVVPTVDGAAEAGQYEHLGPGPFTASVYRPIGSGRDFRTLIDGFDLSNLEGNFQTIADVGTKPNSDNGRIAWFDDVVAGQFQICARRGPVVAVGDLPGSSGRMFTNANLGSFPNPAFAGRAITLRFTLAKAQDVTVRIYNVAGREIANFTKKGVEGPNQMSWDGTLSNGAKATAGVYFYALDGVQFERASSKTQKMILLGSLAN